MEQLRQFLVSRFWNRSYAGRESVTWPHELVARRQINSRIAGSPDIWPIEWLAERSRPHRYPRAVSLGCGEGSLERDLMAKDLCDEILGLDISDHALKLAAERAAEKGLATLRYERADLDRLQLEPNRFDAVFAHQALHHVRRLESCLDQVSTCLVPGGLLYIDEYVGPSRTEWNRKVIARAEEVYGRLPKRIRRRRRLQLPVDWRDPSEAVRSSEIVPLISERFEVEVRRDYGGNLLSVIYPHLRLGALETEERDDLLSNLLAEEDELLAAGESSFYTVLIATKRDRSRQQAAAGQSRGGS